MSPVARVDAELVRRGLARSRGQAGELIRAGRVRVDGGPALKPAQPVAAGRRDRGQPASRTDGDVGRVRPSSAARSTTSSDHASAGRGGGAGHRRGREHRWFHPGPAGARRDSVLALDVGHGQLAPRWPTTRGSSERPGRTCARWRRPTWAARSTSWWPTCRSSRCTVVLARPGRARRTPGARPAADGQAAVRGRSRAARQRRRGALEQQRQEVRATRSGRRPSAPG